MGIDVRAVLANKFTDLYGRESYGDDIEERVNALGLRTLLPRENDFGRQPHEHLKKLDDLVGVSASKLSKIRWKFRYNASDINESIKYLELFCLYCCQFSMMTGSFDMSKVKEGPSIDPGRPFFYDSRAVKAVKELEALLVQFKTASSKKSIKLMVKSILKHVDKILLEDLSRSEREANIKSVKKAQTILKRLA